MKKILTSLFALAAVFCASATPSLLSVSPVEGSIQNREDLKTVTFTFSEAVTVPTARCVGGERFNSIFTDVELNMTAPSKTVKVTVPSTAWGDPTGGQYLLTVNLPAIYDNKGNQIMVTLIDENTEEEYEDAYTASASYTSPFISNAKFIGLDPDPETTTVWDVYSEGWGFVNFLFDGEVGISDSSSAEISFLLEDGDEILVSVSADDLWADWDFWTGSFAVTVPMQEVEEVEKANLVGIEVYLSGVKVGANLKNYTASYEKVGDSEAAKRMKKTASSKLQIATQNTSIVYDITGKVILNEGNGDLVKNLPAGIYVMDGKKFIVR